MMNKRPITVAKGDGIGPEIMEATLKILEAAKAPIAPEFIEVGEKVYLSGNTTGIPDSAWESLRRTKILLKAPITTPQGGGYKSLNVTMRKAMGLFANVRPCRALAPYVATHHPKMDLVIVRENEEDLYSGIEYRQTQDAYTCLKVITRQGCEKIIQYAFEYARQFNRRKVTCMSKDNIMKMTDGLFHATFDQIAKLYPEIQTDHMIIDIGTARLASRPESFDVIVTENLYGDIISDVAAEVVGSVGMAGSSNIGATMAIFEAIHGSAPDIAGRKIANPSGLLNAAIQLLIHIGAPREAALIENAWLATLEAGIHTADIYREGVSARKVDTDEFADAVIAHLGKNPAHFAVAQYAAASAEKAKAPRLPDPVILDKALVGIDIFVNVDVCNPVALGERLAAMNLPLNLQVIMHRGMKVWPDAKVDDFCADYWQCRFMKSQEVASVKREEILQLLEILMRADVDVIKTENLYTFDGERGFALAQGQ